MARPKKGEELRASTRIGLRLTPELRRRLDALARAAGRSITDEARYALEEHVRRAERAAAGASPLAPGCGSAATIAAD